MAEKQYTVSLSPAMLKAMLEAAGLTDSEEYKEILAQATAVEAEEKADKALVSAESTIRDNINKYITERLNPSLSEIPKQVKLIKLNFLTEKQEDGTLIFAPVTEGFRDFFTDFTTDACLTDVRDICVTLQAEMSEYDDKSPEYITLDKLRRKIRQYNSAIAQQAWYDSQDIISDVYIKEYSKTFLDNVDIGALPEGHLDKASILVTFSQKDKDAGIEKARWGIADFSLTGKKKSASGNGRGKSSEWLKGTEYTSATAYAEAHADETLRKSLDKWNREDPGNAWKHIQAQSHIKRIEKDFPKEKQLYTNYEAANS